MLSAIKARVAACLSATRQPQQCQTVPPGLTSPGGKTRKWNRSIDRRCERLITIAVSASIYNALMFEKSFSPLQTF